MRKIYFSPFLLLLFLVFLPQSSWSQTHYPSTGRVVLKYNQSAAESVKEEIHRQIEGKLITSIPQDQVEVWELNDERSFNALQAYASQNDHILYLEPDYIYQMEETPDDPYFEKQWGLSNLGQTGGSSGADIKISSHWNTNTGNKSVITGIIDTGIDWGHEDLVDNIWQNLAEDFDGDGHTIEWIDGIWQLDPGDLNNIDEDNNGYTDDLIGWDFVNDDNNPFDDNGHGTHVAGIVGAKGNNGKGIAGVSWTTQMMALKAFDAKGAGSVLSILPALEYARNMGARLTNNSWGGPAYSQVLYDEISLSNTAGILCVSAAGNNANNNTATPIYPGSFDLANVICVAATDHKDKLARFSNYSHKSVDLGAPGKDIFSTLPGNAYGYKSGTSMASPMATGAICLLWSQDTLRTHEQIKEILFSTVDQLPKLAGKCATGGRINLFNAAAKINNLCEDFLVNTDSKKVQSIILDGEIAWFGTNYGIYESHIYNCEDTIWDDKNVLDHRNTHSLAKDSQGNLWVGTDQGLVMYDGADWVLFNMDNSDIPGDKVKYIFADQGDTLWLAIDGVGLAQFDGTNWTLFEDLFPTRPIVKYNAVMRDSANVLWFAHDQGLTKIAGTDTTEYNTDNSDLPSIKILTLAADSLNQLWIGSYDGGLIKFDGSNWKIYNSTNSGLVDDKVQALCIDQNGFIWAGTNQGLNKFDGNAWVLYDNSDPIAGLPYKNTSALYNDANNNLWVGTHRGVFIFSDNALNASFTAANSPCLNLATSFQNSSIGGFTYQWLVDGQAISTDANLSYTFSTEGNYEVSLIANNLYASDTISQSIKILPQPEVDLGPDTTACAAAIALEATISDMTYAWRNLQDTLLATQRVFLADTSGIYILVATSGCGATARDTILVTLSGDCVWAGDVNVDGKVDMLDYLSLGIANGSSGPARSDATSQWQSETATNWVESFDPTHAYNANVNYKHADCNGDGVVDILTDGAVIMQNVGFSHEALEVAGSNSIYLSVEPTLTTMMASDTFTISYDIQLSDANGGDVEGVYGVAFTLDYNLPLSQTPNIEMAPTLSGELHSAIITYDDKNVATGRQVNAFRRRMAVGMVGSNKSNQSVSKSVGRLSVIVVLEDIQEDEGVLDFTSFSITPSNLVIIDSVGKAKAVSNQTSSATSTVMIYLPAATLPIEFFDFSATPSGNAITLNWTTAQESGVEKYTIQRSRDGISFKNLSRIPSRNEGSDLQEYSYIDTNPLNGNNYYRIQYLDSDGAILNSKVELVERITKGLSFSVYPNPSSGSLGMRIQANQAGIGRLRLRNSLGQLLVEKQINIQAGSQDISLDISKLNPGIYYAEFSNREQRKVAKIILVRGD
ncbi:MAG: S8 family serine peptidase [Bacteroidia bacterium]